MAKQIVVPDLGESVTEADVGAWLKREGDRVEVGEAVVTLDTDKADLEVGAEAAGVLARIEREQGDTVRIGDVLGVIEERDGAGGAAPGEADEGEAAAAGEEAKTGERESAGEPAEAAGRGEEQASDEAPEREEVPGGRREPHERDDADGREGAGGPRGTPFSKRRATPVAQRVAAERDVDLAEVEGTGRGGRVTKRDVLDFRSPEAPSAPGERESERRPEERQRMSRRRRTIARRLVEAQRTAAALTTFNDVDMSGVADLRRRRGEAFESRHGVRLGITSFFVRAAVAGLQRYPRLNAEIQGDEIVLKRYYDIGIAVGASGGLVVPVLRDADRLSLAEIERRIADLAQRAEREELGVEDLRGGTFSITNGGVFGSLLSTPILNPPQVGILGLHRIEERPAGVDGRVVLRPMMYVALGYDHRIVDGREAVRFLGEIKRLIEDPEELLLEA